MKFYFIFFFLVFVFKLDMESDQRPPQLSALLNMISELLNRLKGGHTSNGGTNYDKKLYKFYVFYLKFHC